VSPTLRRALWVTSLMTLAGCAGGPAKAPLRYQADVAQCVAAVDALDALPIPRASKREQAWPKPQDFQQAAGCLRSADGQPVPLLLFAVDGQPQEIQLEFLMRGQSAFAAAIDLLDGDRRRLRTIAFSELVRRGGSYSGTVFLNPDDNHVRYLALRPDAQAVGASDASVVGMRNTTAGVFVASGAVYGFSITTGSEVLIRTWLSEVGEFRVRSLEMAR
jgi:hypothetical protein